MQTYLSVKLTEAEPMTSAEFNTRIGRAPREGEDLNEEGYLVRYPDGYEGWCPKPQFEAACFPLCDASRIVEQDADTFSANLKGLPFGGSERIADLRTITDFHCIEATKGTATRLLVRHLKFVLAWARNGLEKHS